jgi:hypothetical protein
MQLRVEYVYNPESRNWCFRVPSLGVIGGADTREEAERAALDAIAYALESDDAAGDADEAEVEYLQVAIRR